MPEEIPRKVYLGALGRKTEFKILFEKNLQGLFTLLSIYPIIIRSIFIESASSTLLWVNVIGVKNVTLISKNINSE